MLAGVSRAAYYRAWGCSDPLREETALRDVIQRLALANRHYGYRRIGALLRREGWCVNHKRVVRIMREDNLLCLKKPLFRPPTTDARHSWRVWPNLARHLQPMATNQLWVADLTYVRLAKAFIYLAVVLDAFSRKPDAERQSEVGRLGDGRSPAGEPGPGCARDGIGQPRGDRRRPGSPLGPRHPTWFQPVIATPA